MRRPVRESHFSGLTAGSPLAYVSWYGGGGSPVMTFFFFLFVWRTSPATPTDFGEHYDPSSQGSQEAPGIDFDFMGSISTVQKKTF